MTTAAAAPDTHVAAARRTYTFSPATVATILVIALFVAMRLWRLTDFALDGDEIFSIKTAERTWGLLTNEAIKDAIHPPLLYILLKPWIAIGGESLFWLRLFPVSVSILCLAPVFALCRDLKISPAARNMAIGIVAVHPYALYYSQHLRMYSLLMLAVIISAWRFERYLYHPTFRNVVLLGAANLFLGYTQYYGWCVVLLEFLYLCWRRRNPMQFLLWTLPAVILFLPWAAAAGAILHERGLEHNLGWISRPQFQELNWFWVDLTGFAQVMIDYPTRVVAVILVVFFAAYWRGGELGPQWLMWLWLLPAPIAFLVSQRFSQSIWGHRHLLFAIWPFFLLFSDSVWRVHKLFGYAVSAAVIVWGLHMAEYHSTETRKLPWDVLAFQMLEADQTKWAHVELYTIDPYLNYPLEFNLDRLKSGRVGPLGPRVTLRPDLKKLIATAARFEVVQTDDLDDVIVGPGRHFWVAWTDSSWHDKLTPAEKLGQDACEGGPEISQFDDSHHVWLAPIDCH